MLKHLERLVTLAGFRVIYKYQIDEEGSRGFIDVENKTLHIATFKGEQSEHISRIMNFLAHEYWHAVQWNGGQFRAYIENPGAETLESALECEDQACDFAELYVQKRFKKHEIVPFYYDYKSLKALYSGGLR